MVYTCKYKSPLGNILLAADEIGLTGLWFEGQKYFANTLPDEHISQETEILTEAKKWLDVFFSGEEPKFTPPLHPAGSEFRQAVWKILLQIPYGHTITYGEIARKMAERKHASHMSAQAVGGAVGHNEISMIIPCHRVVGTNGSLTGYAGGIDKKISLLKLEHADMNHLFIPKKGTAMQEVKIAGKKKTGKEDKIKNQKRQEMFSNRFLSFFDKGLLIFQRSDVLLSIQVPGRYWGQPKHHSPLLPDQL